MRGAQIIEQPWFLGQKVFAIANGCPDMDACAMRPMDQRLYRNAFNSWCETNLKLNWKLD